MAHMIKSQEDVRKLRECIEMFKKEGMNANTLNIAINRMLPRDYHGLLIDYRIKDQGIKTAEFIPRSYRIDFSIDKCNKWLDENVDSLAEFYHIRDKETFRAYLSVLLPLHEIEHTYQYLMGKGLINCPYEIVSKGYKNIYDLLIKPNDVLPHPIRDVRRTISLIQYYKKQEFYILERNAQFEASGGMLIVARNDGHEEMIEAFNDMAKTYLTIGYEKDNKGCMYHTYKDLMMLDYYKKMNINEPIKPDNALRYGLEVSEEVREDILCKALKKRTK